MAPSVTDPNAARQPISGANTPAPDDGVETRAPRPFILLFTAVVGLAAALVLVPFWAPMLIGATLAGMVFPRYAKLLATMPNRPKTAAVLTALGILGAIVAPLLALVAYGATQLTAGADYVRHLLDADSWQDGLKRAPPWAQQTVERILGLFQMDLEQLRGYAEQAAQTVQGWLPQLFGTSTAALGTLLMALVACSVFLVEGPHVKELTLASLPLQRDDAENMLHRLRMIAIGSISGLGCVAVSHGLVIAVAFWLVGVQHVPFFGILAMFAAFIPAVGSMLLYVPVAVVLGLVNAPWLGVALFLGCLLGTQLLTNLLRPVAQRGRMPLHGALNFFGTLGALTLFGLVGALVGPMVMVAGSAVFEVYRRDYMPRRRLLHR